MKSITFDQSTWTKFAMVALMLGISACGSQSLVTRRAFNRQVARAASSTGSFAGNWNAKLKNTADGCQLGSKGKSYNAVVAITQKGTKITLAIEGLPKSFKGTASSSYASGSGTYTSEGITMRTSVSVTKTAAKRIRIDSAVMNLKTSEKNCRLVFAGSGTKI